MSKKALRKRIFQMRDQLTKAEIEHKSDRIAEHLYSLPVYQSCQTIMFFLTFRSEVNTRRMVEHSLSLDKQVLVPKAIPETREMIASRLLDWDQDLELGNYNIPEPRSEALRRVEPEQIDVVIVPGVAFDEKGNRMGYGGGYYDRFFELLRPDAALVALAFELQIVPQVPVERWDRPVDWIVTEDRILHPAG